MRRTGLTDGGATSCWKFRVLLLCVSIYSVVDPEVESSFGKTVTVLVDIRERASVYICSRVNDFCLIKG